jgi:hypothetical protein
MLNVSQERKGEETPVEAPKAQGTWDFQISRPSAHEGDKVSPSIGRLYPPRNILGAHFC